MRYPTRLKEQTRGDTWNLAAEAKVNGAAVALDGTYAAWFTLKEHPDDTDANAVLQRMSTLAGGSDSEIAFATSTKTGVTSRIEITVTAALTAALENNLRTYFWDLQLRLPSGAIKTIDAGTITMQPEITRTTTTV